MKIFETKTELQQAKLTEEQLVQIKGSSTPNDGQTNFYYIRTPAQYSGTPDEVNDLTLANGNIAELMTGQTRFQNDQLQIWNGTSYEGVRKQRNYITDGRFFFWYEGTNQTSSGYGSDTMWQNRNDGSTKTHTQETLTIGVDLPAVDNPTAEFYSRTVVNSVAGASNNVVKLQLIESVRTLAGKKANISLYAKADSTKNISIEFEQNFGTGGSPSASVDSIGTNKFQITASWVRYDFTVDIPSIVGKTLGTNDDDSLNFLIWFDAGSTFDSRTDSLGQQSGTFDIACVQLEEGESDTKFEELSPEEAQSAVERYVKNRLFRWRGRLPTTGTSRFQRTMETTENMRTKQPTVTSSVSEALGSFETNNPNATVSYDSTADTGLIQTNTDLFTATDTDHVLGLRYFVDARL